MMSLCCKARAHQWRNRSAACHSPSTSTSWSTTPASPAKRALEDPRRPGGLPHNLQLRPRRGRTLRGLVTCHTAAKRPHQLLLVPLPRHLQSVARRRQRIAHPAHLRVDRRQHTAGRRIAARALSPPAPPPGARGPPPPPFFQGGGGAPPTPRGGGGPPPKKGGGWGE